MELNKNDLVNLATIIDLATQRGLFKASDLSAIAQLYEKLKNLIGDPVEQTDQK